MTESNPRIADYAAGRRLFDALAVEEAGMVCDPDLPRVEGYSLLKHLGSGGGGDVYFAVGAGGDRPLAIKILRESASDVDGSRAWRELDLLEHVRLPFVPRVHDYGVDGGRLYLVTDYVEGLSLTEYCDAKRLDRTDRVKLLARLADNIQGLHERGVLHRDIKPSNVIVDMHDEPVIIDLGIAQVINCTTGVTAAESSRPFGSPAYMAPEQARGERQQVSTRTDVYGLGATAFSVLTGQTPFKSGDYLNDAVRHVAQDRPRDVRTLDRSIPQPLAMVLNRAVAPDPADRYESASAFAADLRRWLDGEPINWTNPSSASRLRFWMRRHPWSMLTGVAAVLALMLAATMSAVAVTQARGATTERGLRTELEAKAAALEATNTKLEASTRETIESLRMQEQWVMQAIEVRDVFNATMFLGSVAEVMTQQGIEDDEAPERFASMLKAAIAAAREPSHE